MTLYPNWKTIVRKAWSIRLIILAGLLSGIEVALQFFQHTLPNGTFAALSAVATAGAFISRIVAQKDV